MRGAGAWAAALAVAAAAPGGGCGEGAAPGTAASIPGTAAATATTVATAVAAATAMAAASAPAAESAPASAPVAFAEETLRLKYKGRVVSASGQTWSWTVHGHKHYVSGGAIGIWEFKAAKDGKTVTVPIRGEELYAEGVAFGQLFILKGAKDGAAVVKLHPTAPKRLSEDAALAMGGRTLKTRKLPEPTGSSSADEGNGTYSIGYYGFPDGKYVVDVLVGLYTHKVLRFERGPAPADGGSPL